MILGRFVERIKRDQFLLARSSQLLGCFINKVASSSFVKTFLALEGMRVEKVTSPHAYRPRLVPEVLINDVITLGGSFINDVTRIFEIYASSSPVVMIFY